MHNANDGDKRQRLIQWDEVTIAEHDRERGSRQKIDEAPTPFRYLSESDQSECESCASTDSADVTTKRKSRKNKLNATYISPPSNQGNSVGDSWEAINAKLNYEKHLQDIHDEHELNKDIHSEEIHQELTVQRPTEFGEIIPSTVGGNNQKGGSNGNSSKGPKSIFIKSHDTASAASAAKPYINNSSLNGTTHTGNVGVSSGNGSNGGGSALHHNHHHGQHSIHFSNSPQISPKPSHNGLFAGINGSIGGNSHTPQEESQFKNKRAGHYNEFKVLQAMRNKLAAEDSDEDQDN